MTACEVCSKSPVKRLHHDWSVVHVSEGHLVQTGGELELMLLNSVLKSLSGLTRLSAQHC